MAPSVGRIVHYHNTDGIQPALVTGVYQDGSHVDLQIFPRTRAPEIRLSVENGTAQGCWFWPPRVAE